MTFGAATLAAADGDALAVDAAGGTRSGPGTPASEEGLRPESFAVLRPLFGGGALGKSLRARPREDQLGLPVALSATAMCSRMVDKGSCPFEFRDGELVLKDLGATAASSSSARPRWAPSVATFLALQEPGKKRMRLAAVPSRSVGRLATSLREENRQEPDAILGQLRYLDMERRADSADIQETQLDKVWASQIAGQENVKREIFDEAAEKRRVEEEALRNTPEGTIQEEMQKALKEEEVAKAKALLVAEEAGASKGLVKADEDRGIKKDVYKDRSERLLQVFQQMEDAKADLSLKLKRRNGVPGRPAINMHGVRITNKAACDAEFGTAWRDGKCFVAGEPVGPETPEEVSTADLVEKAKQELDQAVEELLQKKRAYQGAQDMVKDATLKISELKGLVREGEEPTAEQKADIGKAEVHLEAVKLQEQKVLKELDAAKVKEAEARATHEQMLRKELAVQRAVEKEDRQDMRITKKVIKQDAELMKQAEKRMDADEEGEAQLIMHTANQTRALAERESLDDPARAVLEKEAGELTAESRAAKQEARDLSKGDMGGHAEEHLRQRDEAEKARIEEEQAFRVSASQGRGRDVIPKETPMEKNLNKKLELGREDYESAVKEEYKAMLGKEEGEEAHTTVEEHLNEKGLEAADTQMKLKNSERHKEMEKVSPSGFNSAFVPALAAPLPAGGGGGLQARRRPSAFHRRRGAAACRAAASALRHFL